VTTIGGQARDGKIVEIYELKLVLGNNIEISSNFEYKLFSSLSKLVPEWHQQKEIMVVGFRNIEEKNHFFSLKKNHSFLLFRSSDENKLMHLYDLLNSNSVRIDEKDLFFENKKIIYKLETSNSNLYCPFLTIKSKKEKDKNQIWFLDALIKQCELFSLDIKKEQILIGKFRSLSIKQGYRYGYEVLIQNLNKNEQNVLLKYGLGGARNFGAGIFSPTTTEQIEVISQRIELRH
jgi:hypothetical protein